jgi:hypothetical protein
MAYRRNRRGFGASPPGVYDCSGPISWYLSSSCWSQPREVWAAAYSKAMSPIAPPQAPTGDVLTVPPASGADAQATVDALVNQQMADQQAKNAAGVTSSWWDQIVGAPVAAASSLTPGSIPWGWIIGGVGLLAFGMVAIGGGSSRRYGR